MTRWLVLAAAASTALVVAASASAHARISPDVSVAHQLQLYSLAVPTEKENVKTTKVVLTVPAGFSIDSFVPAPGWTRTQQQQTVTWTGGDVPTDEDAFFQFLGEPAKSGTYAFQVQQTYSDGSVVSWSGSESSESPAPTIEAKSSLGGDGTSTLTIVALALAAAALVVALAALLARGGRELA